MLVGILIVVYQRSPTQVAPEVFVRAVAMAIGAVFLTAAGVVAMKPILSSDGFYWLVALRLLAGTLGMVLAIALRNRWQLVVSEIVGGQHRWGLIFLSGLFGTYLALTFWLAGFKYANASIASVLNETSSVFIVIMAFLFLQERIDKRRVAGITLTFIGVLVFLGLGG